MDLRIKPDRLQLHPQADNAKKDFAHWLACFEAYIESATDPIPGAQKLQILYTWLSSDVFPLIQDPPTYAEAMALLKVNYAQQTNKIYARHPLSTRHQLPGESVEDFWRALLALVRDCDCQAVSAAEHSNLLMRDAFITGMGSAYTRQRLLEGATLDLAATKQLALSLTVASRNVQAYAPDRTAHSSWASRTSPTATPSWTPSVTASSQSHTCAVQQPTNPEGPKCYFCGQTKHSRQHCPAWSVLCKACGKKGHFAAVCQARSIAAIVPAPPACGQWAPLSSSLHLRPRLARGRYHLACFKTNGWSHLACPRTRAARGRRHLACLRTRAALGRAIFPASGPLPPSGTSLDRSSPATATDQPRLASVTIDQSRPHNLATASTNVKVDGHEISCLLDSGSTESFIHPDTDVHLRGFAPNVAGSSRTRSPPQARAAPQGGPVG
ncbi:uncharacterized protein [Scyliorhinus torazame]|uniref:uncharacterized protein n=1 Tax=Scyliorhinus torazame TaxID=75743 RepID=UPI003B5CD304